MTRYLPVRDGDDAKSSATTTTGENQPAAFDLRAHIESAGHQLSGGGSNGDGDVGDGGSTTTISTIDRRRRRKPLPEQQQFWIDCTSCRGYLKKLCGAKDSRSGLKGGKWKRRWFVFDRRTRTLNYYRRQSDEPAVDDSNATEKKTGVAPRASIRFQVISPHTL